MWNGQSVSVVFSTYRDIQTIRAMIDGLLQTGVVDEVVAVDNNAEEGTREEIEKTAARRVFESRQGLGYGFQRGLREATGDILITIEVDGTYSPGDVVKLLVYSDQFDVVCGTRSEAAMSPGSDRLTRWANVVYGKLVQVLFNTARLTDVGCIFRLMKRPAWRQIEDLPMEGGWPFNLDWMLMLVRKRIEFVEVPVNFLPRTGESVGAGSSRVRAGYFAVQMLVLLLKHRLNIVKVPR